MQTNLLQQLIFPQLVTYFMEHKGYYSIQKDRLLPLS